MRIHKKKTIVTWCLSVIACTCLAFSAVFFNAPYTGSAAELSSVNAVDLISAKEGVTVTPNKNVNAKNVTGLAIESEGAYETGFNATFTGDLLLNYIFPGEVGSGGNYKYGDANGNFSFKIEDATNPDNYFTLNYINMYTNVRLYAEYIVGETTYIRTANYSTKALVTAKTSAAFSNGNAGTSTVMFNNATNVKNQLKFTWSGDNSEILTVSTLTGKYGTAVDMPIIKFDGATEIGATYDDAFAVPKISFPNGYKVSFKSTYDTGTDICFTKIGDIDLATATAIDADKTVIAGAYNVNGESMQNGGKIEVAKGTDITVSGLTGYSLKGLGTSCGTCVVNGAASAVSYTGTYNKNVPGEYALNIGEFSFTVKVVAYVDLENLVSADNGATIAKKTVNAGNVKGLAVESEIAYSGNLNAVFNGDLDLRFIFQGDVESIPNHSGNTVIPYGDGKGAFQIIISDAENSDKKFTVNYVSIQAGTTWERMISYVEYNDGSDTYQRTWNTQSSGGYVTDVTAVSLYAGYSQRPSFNNATANQNGLQLKWTEDVLTVAYLGDRYNNTYYNMIAFDGLVGETLSKTVCGVPKISFPNGYKVSFKSDYATGTDVCFTQINGVTLSDYNEFKLGASTGTGAETVVDGDKKNLNAGDTVELYTGQALNLSQMSSFSLVEIPRTTVLEYVPFEYTGNLDLTTAGTYTIASKNNPSFTLNVKVTQGVKITYMVNGAPTGSVSTGAGETIVLAGAPAPVEGKVFIGWTANPNDGLFPAGASYIVPNGDTTLTAVYIEFAMVDGASVRMSNPSGIRFTSKISAESAGSSFINAMGTLVIPVDLLGNKEFTIAGLGDTEYLDIVRTTWLSEETLGKLNLGNTEGYQFFTGVVTNVKQENYARAFAARTYIEVLYYDGVTAYFYSDYTETNNARSISYVAEKALEAGEQDYNGVLQSFINGVANVNISKTTEYAFAKGNENATYTVAGNVVANVSGTGEDFTITITGANVYTVILNGVKIDAFANTIDISGTNYTVKNVKVENGENVATITFTTGNTYVAENGIDEALKTALTGKTVSIFGDSISTWGNVSTGGASWYDASHEVTLEETWWKQVIDNYGLTLGVNGSKGGLGFYKNGGGTYAMAQSDVDKMNFSTTANDLVFLFLGTNDSAESSNLTGSYEEITGGERKAVLESADGLANAQNFAEKYYNLLWQVCESVKNNASAKIVIVTPFDADGVAIKGIIEDLATGFDGAYSCEIAVVDLTASELATSLNSDHALFDGAASVHPNEQGMNVITDKVIEVLKALYVK